MSSNSYQNMSNRSPDNHTLPSYNGRETILKTPTSPSDPSKFTFTRSVMGCSLVFSGETAPLDFWNHLEQPELHGLSGKQSAISLNLHTAEKQRYPAVLGLTPLS
ncbi:hypothetical protein HOY82DRAFT_536660 [Tuber indicum]|nr:hypothetical protein HOY82DRAFT_536660 [Tuber indicum]